MAHSQQQTSSLADRIIALTRRPELINPISRRNFVRWLGVASTGARDGGMLRAGALSADGGAEGCGATHRRPGRASGGAHPGRCTRRAAPATRDVMAQWDELAANAKKEGKVVVNTFPGTRLPPGADTLRGEVPGHQSRADRQ